MRHFNAISFSFFFLTARLVAAPPDLKLKLELASQHAVAGQPLPIKIVFSADAPISLPGHSDFCDGHLNLHVLDEAGKPADWTSTFPSCPTFDFCYASGADKPSLTIRKLAEFEIILVPGKYRLQASFDSKGPYQSCNRTPLKFWEGSIQSQEEIIEVVSPGSADRKILNELGINEAAPAPSARQYLAAFDKIRWDGSYAQWIIKKFPESLYAAYAFAGPKIMDNFSSIQGNVAETRSALELLNALRNERRPSGACKASEKGLVIKGKTGDCPRYSQAEMQRDNIAVGEAILKYHPDFPYLENAKFKLAQSYLILREDANAIPLLTELSTSSPDSERQFLAKSYLQALHIPSNPMSGS